MARKKWISWISVAIVLAGWSLFLRPAFLGGPASYVMVTGVSMEPRMHTGDLVIATHRDVYRPGDVVVFRVPEGEPGAGATVIHRVMGGNGSDGYIIKGDNRELADQWRPTDADVHGRMSFLVPKAGSVVSFLRSSLGIAIAAGLTVFLMIVLEGRRELRQPSPAAPAGG